MLILSAEHITPKVSYVRCCEHPRPNTTAANCKQCVYLMSFLLAAVGGHFKVRYWNFHVPTIITPPPPPQNFLGILTWGTVTTPHIQLKGQSGDGGVVFPGAEKCVGW